MTKHAVNQFVELRKQLIAEKADLEARLARITEALEGVSASPVVRGVRKQKRAATSRVGKRVKNKLTLKEAVIKATNLKPLTKAEILGALPKLGYKLSGKNPAGSLNTLLYGRKPKFKNMAGKFQVVGSGSN